MNDNNKNIDIYNDTYYDDDVDFKFRKRQRELRMREMRRKKKQQELIRKIAIPLCLIAVGIVGFTAFSLKGDKETDKNSPVISDNNIDNTEIKTEADINPDSLYDSVADTESGDEEILFCNSLKTENISVAADKMISVANYTMDTNEQKFATVIEDIMKYKPLDAVANSQTTSFNGNVVSSNGILIDLDDNVILAQKDASIRISPASMTKILTLLVAAENVQNLDDKFTITIDITDYSYVNDCSNTGFEVGETVTVRDLMYGTILPSGADAAVGLATYVAGSHEAFVDMMNEKLDELGLSDTAHFTNCVGLYDEAHYCTLYDMAVIMKAVADNELCREVMSAKTYTTSFTPEHPEGITISNWFLRRIEDKDTHGEVLYAKTGFVAQSGSCAVSYARSNEGKDYICVTANSTSSWRCIYDHVEIYQSHT